MNISQVLSDNRCKIVFLIALIVGYILVPAHVFAHAPFIAWPFLVIFSITTSCTIKAMMESARANKGHGLISIFSSFFGLAALSACSTSFVCGAAGVGILSMFVQGLSLGGFMHEFGVYIIVISSIVQIYTLKKMGCFKHCVLLRFLVSKEN